MNAALVTASAALDDAIARTAARYARVAKSRGAYFYVLGKLRGDPATRAIATLAPLGDVLDLGSGRGQLAALLLESGAARSVRGVDADAEKVRYAVAATAGLDARFVVGDLRDADVAPADTVLMVDVIHYFDRDAQDALLARAAALVKPGGRLVVREATTGEGLRSWLTQMAERIAKIVRLNRGERLVFRDVLREMAPIVEAAGMRCEVKPCWQGTPFANVLLVAERAR